MTISDCPQLQDGLNLPVHPPPPSNHNSFPSLFLVLEGSSLQGYSPREMYLTDVVRSSIVRHGSAHHSRASAPRSSFVLQSSKWVPDHVAAVGMGYGDSLGAQREM